MNPPINITEINTSLVAVEEQIDLEKFRFWESLNQVYPFSRTILASKDPKVVYVANEAS